MDSGLLQWVRILALKSVESPTYEDFYDSICRNYCEKFHTPLHQVYELDQVFVVKQFYASQLAALYFSSEESDKAQYEKMREQILAKPGTPLVAGEEAEDEDWVKKLEAEMRASLAQTIENTKIPAIVSKETIKDESPNLTEDLPAEFRLPDSGSMGE